MQVASRVSQQLYKPGSSAKRTITGTVQSFDVNMIGGPEVLVLWDGDEPGMETGENPEDLALV
jgi:hypothetical protein